MLQPKKTKFRRQQKGRMKGEAQRGNQLAFGSFGIKALENKWITGRQIEAARIAVTRYMQRQGQVWVRIFPDKPITKKPAEVRMGKGKGNPEGFVAPVTPGRLIFEIEGVPFDIAKEALRLAAQKLPVTTKFVVRRDYDMANQNAEFVMKIAEIRELSTKELVERIDAEVAAYDQKVINHSISPSENPAQIKQQRRMIARMKTELRQRELNNKN